MPATEPNQPSRAPAPAPTGRRRRGRRHRALLLGLVALLLAVPTLTACGAGSGSDEAASPQQAAARDGEGPAGPEGAESGSVDAEGRTEAGAADAAAGTGGPTGVDPAGFARSSDRRVRRADVTLEVADLATGAAQVRRLAAEHDGYVSTEALGLRAAGDVPVAPAGPEAPEASDVAPWPPPAPGQALLVLRVPQPRLDEAVASLAAIGTEVARRTSERVVEADLVDLDARVATATRSVTRVRDLMAEAGSLADVLALEVELARREGDLEALRARRDTLAGQAAQATLSVALLTPESVVAGGSAGGFAGGLAAGWSALVAATAVALTAVGAVLPFATVAAVVAVPLLVRSRRRRGAGVAATAPGGDATA